jgi:hypothetical protein
MIATIRAEIMNVRINKETRNRVISFCLLYDIRAGDFWCMVVVIRMRR